MILELNFIFLTLLVICAIGAVTAKKLLSSIVIFSVYSFFMAIAFAQLNAVDVALTEAAIGAGITTLLFVAALFRISKGEKD